MPLPSPQRTTNSLSPPPLKRRRLSPPPTSASTSFPLPQPAPSTLRIFTWNVNGIAPFLPSIPPRNQKQITKFFSPTRSNAAASSARAHGARTGVKASQPSLRACLARWHWPEVVCLQEVKIGREDAATQRAVQAAINNPRPEQSPTRASDDEKPTRAPRADAHAPAYEAHFALPRDRFNARGPSGSGKVYGVCTLVRRDLENVTIDEVDWDPEGRVLVLKIPSFSRTALNPINAGSAPDTVSREPAVGAAKGHSRGLVVFNVYAVNGTELPYRDPTTGSLMGDRHGHKRRFHTRLAAAVGAYENEAWDVVVAGDLNISRSHLDSFPAQRMGKEHVENRADFESKFMSARDGGLGMVDAFREIHGEERKYTYRPTGRPWGSGMDRVDLILCSKGAMMRAGNVHATEKRTEAWRLLEADILDTAQERGSSDHVPQYIAVQRR